MMFSRYSMWDWGNRQVMLTWILPFAVLDLVLRGFALWKSARKGEQSWFIALMVVNSLGILPGIYLLTHQETKSSSKKK